MFTIFCMREAQSEYPDVRSVIQRQLAFGQFFECHCYGRARLSVSLVIRRAEVRLFSDKANHAPRDLRRSQAVIAIENVRLFKELSERNRGPARGSRASNCNQ